jgi:hypothetical protein
MAYATRKTNRSERKEGVVGGKAKPGLKPITKIQVPVKAPWQKKPGIGTMPVPPIKKRGMGY